MVHKQPSPSGSSGLWTINPCLLWLHRYLSPGQKSTSGRNQPHAQNHNTHRYSCSNNQFEVVSEYQPPTHDFGNNLCTRPLYPTLVSKAVRIRLQNCMFSDHRLLCNKAPVSGIGTRMHKWKFQIGNVQMFLLDHCTIPQCLCFPTVYCVDSNDIHISSVTECGLFPRPLTTVEKGIANYAKKQKWKVGMSIACTQTKLVAIILLL